MVDVFAADGLGAWSRVMAAEIGKGYFSELRAFVERERALHAVYPARGDVFAGFRLTPPESVRVVILGQDPYHGAGQAHGLAFSVPPGIAHPPSLRNIFRELSSDLGVGYPEHGDLSGWARQGVLLLNTVLTVRHGEANSHKGRGWELFTDAVIASVSGGSSPVVFILWGSPAHKKESLIDLGRHAVIRGVHPSPLSAYRGFWGSRPFSRCNVLLESWGRPAVDWAGALR